MNTKSIKDLLTTLKGPERNMTEFAHACGSNPSTFYKIAQGNFRREIRQELLEAMIANAADIHTDITVSDLRAACSAAIDNPYYSDHRNSHILLEQIQGDFGALLLSNGATVSEQFLDFRQVYIPIDFAYTAKYQSTEVTYYCDVKRYGTNSALRKLAERLYTYKGWIDCNRNALNYNAEFICILAINSINPPNIHKDLQYILRDLSYDNPLSILFYSVKTRQFIGGYNIDNKFKLNL